jgi:2,3-bisphosphoglycerate-independent phosphoglycerate mutase
MNEYEEMHILNGLLNKDFSIFVRTKLGVKNVISIIKKNGLMVIRTSDNMQIIEAPKNFLKREFTIKPNNPEPNPLSNAREIYEYLKGRKEILYRSEKVIELRVEQNKLILKLENGSELILSPSDMFEYPVYAW